MDECLQQGERSSRTLQDSCVSHPSRSGHEAQRNSLNGVYVDACPSEAGVYESVHYQDDDNLGERRPLGMGEVGK
jgi:hypothetical protein